MFKFFQHFMVIPALFIFPAFAWADSAVQLSDLAWMKGSWSGTSQAGTYENSFSSTSGGLMVGTAKLTGPDGALSFYEYDEFKVTNNEVQLTPIPFGQRGVSFKIIESSTKQVVFENAAHDFPRRIAYSINEKGQFVSVVEGLQNGQAIRLEFVLDRI